MKWKPVTTTERARMRDLRKQGWSLDRIGAELGRPGRTVLYHVSDIDVRCRPGTKGRGDAARARMLKLADEGMSYPDLAERFGTTRNSIGVTLHRLRRQRRLAAAAQEACAC